MLWIFSSIFLYLLLKLIFFFESNKRKTIQSHRIHIKVLPFSISLFSLPSDAALSLLIAFFKRFHASKFKHKRKQKKNFPPILSEAVCVYILKHRQQFKIYLKEVNFSDLWKYTPSSSPFSKYFWFVLEFVIFYLERKFLHALRRHNRVWKEIFFSVFFCFSQIAFRYSSFFMRLVLALMHPNWLIIIFVIP